ncbi:hypothetical protein Hanom_Chr02g00114821 [Helianthus anomalus]
MSDLWLVSKTFEHQYTGNLSLFKRISYSFGVETRTREREYFFIRRLGRLTINKEDRIIDIPSVFYTINMLTLNQFILQGFVINIDDGKCKILPMFHATNKIAEVKPFNQVTDEELDLKEKDKNVAKGSMHDEFQVDYLKPYFETLDISS